MLSEAKHSAKKWTPEEKLDGKAGKEDSSLRSGQTVVIDSRAGENPSLLREPAWAAIRQAPLPGG